jgi:stress response protein SCP2
MEGPSATMTAARALRPGEALPLSDLGPTAAAGLTVGLTAAGTTPDLVAMLVGDNGKVRTDDDLVFYNNPASADGGVTWTGRSQAPQWLTISPARLDADVDRVVLGAAGGLLEAPVPGLLTVTVADTFGTPLAAASFQADAHLAAMILLEVYRRAGAWRLRLLAQGYAGGLAALVTEFGVDVDDPGTAAAPDSAPSAAPAPSPAPTPAPQQQPAMPQPQPQWQAPGYPPPAPQPQSHPPSPPPQQPAHQPYPAAPPAYPAQPYPGQPGPQWTPEQGQQGRRGLFTSRKRAQLEAQNAELSRLLTATGAMDNAALDAERRRLVGEIADLSAEAERRRADLAGLEQRLQQVRAAIAVAEGDMELTEVGIYNYRHRLDDSIAYKAQLDQLRDRIKIAAKVGNAVTGSTSWTVNGSAAQGRKMVNEVSKLMLRAYNADADHAVRTMRPYKLDSALARLDTTRSTIARLGQTMSIAVTDYYHQLKRAELELTSDYLNKVEEEKEHQRELREQQREQARADAEYAREQAKLERDRDKYADALVRLESSGADPQHIAQVRSQLSSVNAALDQVAYRRSNMRLGYVYVISNIGAFGQQMVKIGMTRRVAPEDRVRELGDASVPFRFDTHALIFSEDAVALETALHQRFADQAVNLVNRQREFFYVTPAEVRQALAEMNLINNIVVEYDEQTPADEWRRSGGPDRALLPT